MKKQYLFKEYCNLRDTNENLYLISKDQVLLVDLFQCVSLLGLLVLDKVDSPVGPVGDEFDNIKVLLSWGLGAETFAAADGTGAAVVLRVRSIQKICISITKHLKILLVKLFLSGKIKSKQEKKHEMFI